MGQAETKPCHPFMTNPDLLSVVTLSDSCVQRLPLASNDSPLDQEAREQNIDDFWRERLACLENSYLETLGVTENNFNRMESKVKNVNRIKRQIACQDNFENLTNSYLVNAEEPLICAPVIKKITVCIDAQARAAARRSYLEYIRNQNKRPRQQRCCAECK